MVSRLGTFGGGAIGCLNVGNISVLNHEGELMDITSTRLHQDLHSCKLCARFMPMNIRDGHFKQK